MNPSPQSPGGIRECTRVRDWFSAATAPRARAAVSQRSRHPRFSAPPAITAAQKAARSLNVAHGSRSRAPGPGSRPVATLEVGGPWPHRRNDRAKPTLGSRRLRLQRVLDRVTDAIFLGNSDGFAALLEARRRLVDAKVSGVDDNLNDGMSRFFSRPKRPHTPPAT